MKTKVPPGTSIHFYWDLKTIMAKSALLMKNKVLVLVIRTEQIWDDWTWDSPLGRWQPFQKERAPESSGNSPGKFSQEVTKFRSVNLTPEEKQNSLDLARKNCPTLWLAFALN
jgi:hypothetical protein